MRGAFQPGRKRTLRVAFIHHAEIDRQAQFAGEALPAAIDRQPLRLLRRTGDCHARAGGSQGRQQHQLAEVLAADPAQRRKQQRRTRRRWSQRPGAHRIGQPMRTPGRQTRGDENVPVARVQKRVMHLRRQRVKHAAAGEQRRVFRPTVLGQIMDVQQQALACRGQHRHQLRHHRVFPQRMIVEMPQVGRSTERFMRRRADLLQQPVRRAFAVSKTLDHPHRAWCFVTWCLTHQNHLRQALPRQCSRLRGDDLAHPARAKMIVDDRDLHAAASRNARPTTSKPPRTSSCIFPSAAPSGHARQFNENGTGTGVAASWQP